MKGRPTILLAEDSPADVYLFREALKAHSIEAELMIFNDGETALEYIVRARQDDVPQPQVFVLDLNLPKVDGRDLLRYLRGSTRFADTPVVILTSSNAPADRELSSELGANCYLCKPAEISEFLRIGGIIKWLLRSAAGHSRGSGPYGPAPG